jgi:hypothetical protein
MRRFAALAFAAMAIVAALPAHAFQKTSVADGSLEYFFAAPSLEIRSSGDLDLTGLSFIDGVEGGFRVGALFDLDWTGGEQALLASSTGTWSGVDTLPRSLSFVAGGNLNLGATRLSLIGGTISLTAGGALVVGDGSLFDVGGTGESPIRGPGVLLPGQPGGGITLVRSPSPIPEPNAVTLLLVGLLALVGVAARRAKIEA